MSMGTEAIETDLESENEIGWITSILNEYNISWAHGFVPETEPLLQFSDPYFSCWDKIVNNLTILIQNGEIRQAVHDMPLLDHNKLGCFEEWSRAYRVLSAIGHGYIWQNGEKDPATVIPKCLAIPWVATAQYIGICPVLTHFAVVVTNWKIIDQTNNVDTQFSFTGHEGEHWFFMLTLQVELYAAPGIRSVVAGQKAVSENDQNLLEMSLITLSKCIVKLQKTVGRMYERCDPEFFYTKLRIFLAGTKNNEHLPGGIIYDGIGPQPLQFAGGSAAESAIFSTFDAALGIVHSKEEDGKPSFIESMLDYMPKRHKEFVFSIREGPSIREYVMKSENNQLKKLFNDCVKGLEDFRSFHIQLVTRYITIQAAKTKHADVKMLAKQGTGGTGIMPFLKTIRKDTSEAKIA